LRGMAMIVGQHTVIRTAERDDARFLRAAYLGSALRASLLDVRKEPVQPTREELEELLGSKETARGLFYAVEDLEGRVCGFCGLRGVNQESLFAEVFFLFLSPEMEAGAGGEEAVQFVLGQAFNRLHLAKVTILVLDGETGLGALLARAGFACEGAQRQAVHARGVWHDVQTWTCFREAAEAPDNHTGGCHALQD